MEDMERIYPQVEIQKSNRGEAQTMEYVLKNQEMEVHFQSTGGTLSSVKDKNGTEYLWSGDATYWSGQAPILFPICGSIREDQAVTESGKKLNMPST